MKNSTAMPQTDKKLCYFNLQKTMLFLSIKLKYFLKYENKSI